MHVVVLGAGLAGLSAGYELSSQGHRVTILEREPVVGGMAASWRRGPYWLEYGPHRFHTQDPGLEAILYEVLDGDIVRRQRMSRIHLRDRFFRYPLEVGDVLAKLDKRILAAALRDYLLSRGRQLARPTDDEHFEAWVLKRFGRTLYELFFEAYTSKAWGMPCTEISADWAAQRISQTSLWDTIIKTVRPPADGSARSLVSEFLYPRRGGVGQIARKYAEKIKARGGEIRLGSSVRALECMHDQVHRVHYDFLGERAELSADWVINTAPLGPILKLVEPRLDVPVHDAADSLEYVAIVFVYLEVDRPSVTTDHWIYLPEKHLRVHRVSEFKNFSDTSAPGDRTALCCEITCRVGDETWNLDLERGAAIAQADLERCGLISKGESRPLDIARLPRAYPVYRVGYRAPVESLHNSVQRLKNFQSTGRQGLFRYNNMDHSMAMGRAAALEVGHDHASVYALPGGHFG
jgi:protoporphyrinogen oxidase